MNEIIFNNIFRDILEISDINYQKEVWLGNNLNMSSSFVEVYCRLFDDNDFSSFVKSIAKTLGFSIGTLQALEKLHYELENYKELKNDKEIIDDPKWIKIRGVALNVIDCWKQDENNFQLKFKTFDLKG